MDARLYELAEEVVDEVAGPGVHPFDDRWLRWNDGALKKIELAWADRPNYGSLRVIGDALEEAGGASEELLRHLRKPTDKHMEGCWALDLLYQNGRKKR